VVGDRAAAPRAAAPRPPDRTPLDILKERYARGEIAQEEYVQRRTDLQD
jgi:uncharacterized membrane protein